MGLRAQGGRRLMRGYGLERSSWDGWNGMTWVCDGWDGIRRREGGRIFIVYMERVLLFERDLYRWDGADVYMIPGSDRLSRTSLCTLNEDSWTTLRAQVYPSLLPSILLPSLCVLSQSQMGTSPTLFILDRCLSSAHFRSRARYARENKHHERELRLVQFLRVEDTSL